MRLAERSGAPSPRRPPPPRARLHEPRAPPLAARTSHACPTSSRSTRTPACGRGSKSFPSAGGRRRRGPAASDRPARPRLERHVRLRRRQRTSGGRGPPAHRPPDRTPTRPHVFADTLLRGHGVPEQELTSRGERTQRHWAPSSRDGPSTWPRSTASRRPRPSCRCGTASATWPTWPPCPGSAAAAASAPSSPSAPPTPPHAGCDLVAAQATAGIDQPAQHSAGGPLPGLHDHDLAAGRTPRPGYRRSRPPSLRWTPCAHSTSTCGRCRRT